ncbi:gamma-tubulin complex component 2 [Schistosoma bovis]|uniref:Gamma-tubulin complex component n=1 Tax=Schistosoma bovis TaxID=6184 RepID=A0A430Q2I1_SCHBO|nr:gamma-tubulin complex component 2 [Schistosoma bovis]
MMNVFQDITHLQHVNDESCTQGSSSEQPARNDSLRPMFGASDELSLFSPCGVGAHSSSFVQASKNTSKKLVSSNAVQPPTFPLQPEWIYSRGTLWDDFLSISLNSEGNQGVYIKPLPLSSRYAVRCFKVDEKMTPALSDTVNKILPVCSDYSTVARFIGVYNQSYLNMFLFAKEKSTFEYGTVNQALAGAMRGLLKDYLILLCQLEYQYKIGQLGIVKLHFFLQETATAFNQLTRLVYNINTGQCSGGAVLSVLYDSLRSVYGVKQLHDLMLYLLCSFFISAGSTPNFYDPDKASPNNLHSASFQFDRFTQNYVDWAFFWECHYSLVPINLPSFLEPNASKILSTGKYLNVVQQCADRYELPTCEELVYNKEHSVFLDKIDQAHLYASSLLLKLMLQQKDLKEHLKSVKRFFLLDQGDFIVHFMDAAAAELRKNSEIISQLRLNSLLELALRTSTANSDPFKDNLSSWILGKLARKCDNLMTTWFTTAFLLAQRMLIFIQHFQYYMSVEIIEPAWHNFFKRVDKVSNLDLLLDSHLHFLEVCMDDCLLASPDLLSLVGKLSVACVTFANFIQHLAFSITGVNLSSSGDNDQCIVYLSRHSNDMERPFLHDPTPSSNLGRTKNDLKYAPRESTTSSVESMMTKVTREEFGRMSLSDDMAKTVTNFDTNFNRMLVELLEKIKQYAKHHSKLLSLVSRLDFNEFYTEFAMQYDQSERSPESPGDHEPSLDKDTLVEHKSVPQTNSESDNEDYI